MACLTRIGRILALGVILVGIGVALACAFDYWLLSTVIGALSLGRR